MQKKAPPVAGLEVVVQLNAPACERKLVKQSDCRIWVRKSAIYPVNKGQIGHIHWENQQPGSS